PPAAPQAPPALAPPKASALPAVPRVAPGAPCPSAEIVTTPLPAGRMRIAVKSACRAGEEVAFVYGGAAIVRKLDAAGLLAYEFDCFNGTGTPLEIGFADKTRRTIDIATQDLDKVSKVTVIWRVPVNLDLHAFEYAAAHNEAGHIWAKTPSSLQAAREQSQAKKRGHGFLGVSDDGRTPGDKIEVYTFWHNEEQVSAAVGMALDFESRGDAPNGEMCGAGTHARVQYEVVVLSRGTPIRRQTQEFAPMDCGTRLTREVRYSQDTVPILRIRK
ncbi:MAG: hypothetical protein ACREC6_13835, partial [Hyphomicrobiaceae bacterium]